MGRLDGDLGVGDFFAPFFTVKILSLKAIQAVVDSDGVPFDEAVTAVSRDFTFDGSYSGLMRNYATSLEIAAKGGNLNIATLKLEPPFDDAIKIVDDQTIQYDSIMVIHWGWLPGAPGGEPIDSGRYLFRISQPSLDVSDLDYSVTIVGIDIFSANAMTRDDHPEWSYADVKTDEEILKRVVGKYDMKLDTAFVEVGSLLKKKRPLNKDEPDSREQHGNDWTFFQEVCRDNDCEFLTIDDTVYVADSNNLHKRAPSYTLIFMRQPRDDRDIVMESFSANPIVALFDPPAAFGVSVVSADLDKGLVITDFHDPTTMPDVEATGPRSAAGRARFDGKKMDVEGTAVVPTAAFKGREVGLRNTRPRDEPNRVERGKQIPIQAAFQANTDAVATVPGHPHLVPFMIVRVECGSKVFSGNYRVMEVTHNIGLSGYSATLKLHRTSSTGDETVGKGKKTKTGGNSKDVDKSAGYSVSPFATDEV